MAAQIVVQRPAEAAEVGVVPVPEREQAVVHMGVAAAALDAIENAARDEVDTALAVADAAPWPEPSAAFTDVQTTGAGQWY